MWYREMLLEVQDSLAILRLRVRGLRIGGKWMRILAVGLLVGAAWHYGIITSVALALKLVVVVIWNMLCDLADACGDFLQYVLRIRNH
jgi:hypothetical protein